MNRTLWLVYRLACQNKSSQIRSFNWIRFYYVVLNLTRCQLNSDKSTNKFSSAIGSNFEALKDIQFPMDLLKHNKPRMARNRVLMIENRPLKTELTSVKRELMQASEDIRWLNQVLPNVQSGWVSMGRLLERGKPLKVAYLQVRLEASNTDWTNRLQASTAGFGRIWS